MDQSKNVQGDRTFAEIETIINTYLAERDWLGNNSRSLAISIALEANELLEHYQWSDKPVGSQQELASELADVLLYSFQLAYNNDIDMAQAIIDKLEVTKKKYPAAAFKNKTGEETQKAWLEAKMKHKKQGL
jgi:NTP pyrophosphatase (non-canonical NTP hydrolase)